MVFIPIVVPARNARRADFGIPIGNQGNTPSDGTNSNNNGNGANGDKGGTGGGAGAAPSNSVPAASPISTPAASTPSEGSNAGDNNGGNGNNNNNGGNNNSNAQPAPTPQPSNGNNNNNNGNNNNNNNQPAAPSNNANTPPAASSTTSIAQDTPTSSSADPSATSSLPTSTTASSSSARTLTASATASATTTKPPAVLSLYTSVSGGYTGVYTISLDGSLAGSGAVRDDNSFFANKGAVAGTFTVVALVVLGLGAYIFFWLAKKRRQAAWRKDKYLKSGWVSDGRASNVSGRSRSGGAGRHSEANSDYVFGTPEARVDSSDAAVAAAMTEEERREHEMHNEHYGTREEKLAAGEQMQMSTFHSPSQVAFTQNMDDQGHYVDATREQQQQEPAAHDWFAQTAVGGHHDQDQYRMSGLEFPPAQAAGGHHDPSSQMMNQHPQYQIYDPSQQQHQQQMYYQDPVQSAAAAPQKQYKSSPLAGSGLVADEGAAHAV